MTNKQNFRHELKYRITQAHKDIMMARLDMFLDRDNNTENGIYQIRSLYFDDYWNSAYEEKQMGTAVRKKYRIRFYNYSDELIKLECKHKQGAYIYKQSARLTVEEVRNILAGNYEILRERKEEVCQTFYYECVTNFLRPRVIVDYERVPYVFEPGNVRITFDYHLQETALMGNLFDPELPSWSVMKPNELIMEVKYTQLLPDFIKDLLTTSEAEYTAASKYVMCCDHKIERKGILI